ncbi:hypothetical protein F5Y16DRAFT_394942 [Xylariaceae sp. FL0255]|nr:hypothetical protein F5Y16DRAFT_394942 [Xylariaceae sp. FL0255]
MRTLHILTAAFTASLASATPMIIASDPTNPSYEKAVSPLGPTQPGAPLTTCLEWIEAKEGMTCWSQAEHLSMSMDDFIAMNPQLKGNCAANFWDGYYYCVLKV